MGVVVLSGLVIGTHLYVLIDRKPTDVNNHVCLLEPDPSATVQAG
ncbi:hypothetical protein [Actinomyces minihominis]|nr:hypothetical protein [Actinomyces minihominis]